MRLASAVLVCLCWAPDAAPGQSPQGTDLPAPCQLLGQTIAIKQCLAREAAMTDTMLDAAFHAALEAQRPASRDSLVADQRAWVADYGQAMARFAEPTARIAADLVAKRSRTFRLRHLILVGAAASDTTRMHLPPARVTFRRETAGRGLILSITNLSGRPFETTVRLYNPFTDELRATAYRIMPNAREDVSWLDGWTVAPGHFVQILTTQFAPVLVIAP